ncbi:transcription termination/antitermination protein NusG [Patescibacteria group bacterium]|nr:transcription termination/antitermination protein NusG [Patescibacteria group bacterium]
MKAQKNENSDMKWYAVNVFTGHEKKVSLLIKQKAETANVEQYIGDIVIPTQNKTIITEGKKKQVKEKLLPGYLLIQMTLNDSTWALIRDTQGVSGFVGMSGKLPTPLNDNEVNAILKFMEMDTPAIQTNFNVDDTVLVTDGAFKDFNGKISEINDEKGKAKILISIFGRETPVELDLMQIKPL